MIHQKGYQKARHHTDCYIAYWVEKGGLRLHSKGQVSEAAEGEWLFQRPCLPDQRYGFQWVPFSTGFEVAFQLRWDGPGHLLLPSGKIFWKSSALPALNEQTLQLFEYARTLFPIVGHLSRFDPVTMAEHLKLQQEFHLWFMTLIKEWDKMGNGINHVVNIDENIALAERLLRTHPWNQPFSIQTLARESGYSTKHFSMLFHQYYGDTPLAYRMRLKLDQVIETLRTTDQSIRAIAHQFGLTQTRLGIWLKRETGKTPSEIRGGR